MHITDINDEHNRLLDCERKIDTLAKSLSLLIDRVNFLQGKVTDSQLAQPEPYLKEILFAFQELKKTIEVTLPEAITNRLLEDFEGRLDDVREECLHINQLSLQEVQKDQKKIKQEIQLKENKMIRPISSPRLETNEDILVAKEVELWNSIRQVNGKFYRTLQKLPITDPVRALEVKHLIVFKLLLDRRGVTEISQLTGLPRNTVENIIHYILPKAFQVSKKTEIFEAWSLRIKQVSGDK